MQCTRASKPLQRARACAHPPLQICTLLHIRDCSSRRTHSILLPVWARCVPPPRTPPSSLPLCRPPSPLQALPENISELVSLRQLHVEWNKLQALPEALPRLTNLTSLRVSQNEIAALPVDVGGCVDSSLHLSTYVNICCCMTSCMVCAFVCARARACVRACVCACVSLCVCIHH